MDRKSTYGLRLDQMADLFAIGAEGPDPAAEADEDKVLRGLLREQLTCIEPKGSLLRDTLVMMLRDTQSDAAALEGRPLGDILLSPRSDVALLGAIKGCSKTLSSTLDSATETALARTVYFAAIAAALVVHDTKITQSTYAALADSLAVLLEKRWMAPELVALFGQAREICRRRSRQA
ncbi:MAG: hypothetical protein JW993_08010 [Sedimentisphaerales bacterium]|nr:hypothetical protein [Sedimentisphaerales bacterium]